MTIHLEIGENIVRLRKQKGLTQEQLALESEMSVSYLRRIEHGEANPTVNELVGISDALEIEFKTLLNVPAAAETVS